MHIMNIVNYFIDEFTETFEYLDTEYVKFSPITGSALACAGFTFISTFFYYIYCDWEPYNGYMNTFDNLDIKMTTFQYKNWAPRYDELRSGERTHTYSTLSNYVIYDQIFTEFIWSGHYTKYQRFFEFELGLTNDIKSVHSYNSLDLKCWREEPWWWNLLFKGLIKYLDLHLYRRYDWVGYRHMYVLWNYNVPFVTLKLNFLLHDTDVVTRLPKIPPLFNGRVIIRTRDIYHRPEQFWWIRSKVWKEYSNLYNCQTNFKLLSGNIFADKNIYRHL